ncbi:MAG: peptidylprolyl isomerase [Cyanobacteria bacterium P01_H01_bin.150]
MFEQINISISDIIHFSKLSCQIPQIIEAIASQKIIEIAAKEVRIEVTEAELQQEGDKIRLEKKLATAKDTWAWLNKHSLSVQDFEELVRNSLISKKLANHLFAPQVEKYFYENRINYEAAVTYEVILEDRDLALELFYAFEEGEITFPEIARLYIQDPELRRAGGYKGVQNRQDFRPEVAAAVFAANPPMILKPITSPKGIYLIWVEEIIQPELDEALREEIIAELFADWLKGKAALFASKAKINLDMIDTQEEVKSSA